MSFFSITITYCGSLINLSNHTLHFKVVSLHLVHIHTLFVNTVVKSVKRIWELSQCFIVCFNISGLLGNQDWYLIDLKEYDVTVFAWFQTSESPPTSLISSAIGIVNIDGCFHQLQKQSTNRMRLKMGMSLSYIASSLLWYIHEK